MIEILLQAIPNQSLSIQLDGRLYNLVIKEINGLMALTLIRDGAVIQDGARMMPNFPLIPYRYQESGNFIMITSNGEYPYYTRFGVSQSLIFASQTELDIIRGT